ncbi:hypothetical protein niasHT_022162 [Heterodera trifolii]|uniref:B30.2/SPRY domain-containing protein n=1 Tax=Heterodera trifolii TaxID=157864 RepID=A0ABD2KP88_9BILA
MSVRLTRSHSASVYDRFRRASQTGTRAHVIDFDEPSTSAGANPVRGGGGGHFPIDDAMWLSMFRRLNNLSRTVEAIKICLQSVLTNQQLNNWDLDNCNEGIYVYDYLLLAEHLSKNNYFVSVRSVMPANNCFGLFYFEITVLQMKSDLGVGLAPNTMQMHELIGHFESSIALWSDGSIHCKLPHAADVLDGFAQFGAGDVVGCGIDASNRGVFFTLNGHKISTQFLQADSFHMYACCTLVDMNDAVQANFGPDFLFNIVDMVPF